MEPIPDISKLNINNTTASTTSASPATVIAASPTKGKQGPPPKKVVVQLLNEEQIKKSSVLLKCEIKDCNVQMNTDNFNGGLQIHMVINKETNDFVIVKVDNQELEEYQLIYSVPKITPYKKEILIQKSTTTPATTTDSETAPAPVEEPTTTFTKFNSYYISNKWNGMNIQVFKYSDINGNLYVSAKPRASPFILNDPKSGPVIDHINEILKRDVITITPENDNIYQSSKTFENSVPRLIEQLLNKKSSKDIQSLVFELCGNKLPHIVKYDFEIDLKPLFSISNKNGGEISPTVINTDNKKFVEYVKLEEQSSQSQQQFNESLNSKVQEIKNQLLLDNQKFRAENGLSENMIWFNHFAEEGRVLYLLGEDGKYLLNHRTIYSIKPKDSEKSHWEQFDNGIQTKVLMTVKECHEKSIPINKDTLRVELDMDNVSWNRHESDILSLALPPTITLPISKSRVVITCGLPACGKSYFAGAITSSDESQWKRINQDDLGTRKKCEDLLKTYLKAGHNVIIDRCNQDISQRRNWIKLAAAGGVDKVDLIWFTIDQTICKDRIVVRENHPTIPKGEEGVAIIDKFLTMFIPPSDCEGFNSLTIVSNENESNQLIDKFNNNLF